MHNRLSVSVTDFHEPILPLAWNGGWKDKGICIQNVPNCDINLPMVSTGEFGTWGGSGWGTWGSPTWSASEEISWVKGKHVFKAGYTYEWNVNTQSIGNQNVSGQVGFSSGYTNLPNVTNTGLGFASFLLGDVSSSTVTTPRFFLLRYNYDAYFIQDDWRVTPKLTINLGLGLNTILEPPSPAISAPISARPPLIPARTGVWARCYSAGPAIQIPTSTRRDLPDGTKGSVRASVSPGIPPPNW